MLESQNVNKICLVDLHNNIQILDHTHLRNPHWKDLIIAGSNQSPTAANQQIFVVFLNVKWSHFKLARPEIKNPNFLRSLFSLMHLSQEESDFGDSEWTYLGSQSATLFRVDIIHSDVVDRDWSTQDHYQ